MKGAWRSDTGDGWKRCDGGRDSGGGAQVIELGDESLDIRSIDIDDDVVEHQPAEIASCCGGGDGGDLIPGGCALTAQVHTHQGEQGIGRAFTPFHGHRFAAGREDVLGFSGRVPIQAVAGQQFDVDDAFTALVDEMEAVVEELAQLGHEVAVDEGVDGP